MLIFLPHQYLLGELGYDLTALVAAKDFAKQALIKSGANAVCGRMEDKKEFQTYAAELVRVMKYLQREDLNEDQVQYRDAIVAIYKELQLKRKHADNTDLMVEINRIISESITSVENELANIRAYVEIQRHMRDFPFCVDYEIEDGVQKLSMLNFLLQPIVENAFKHGIDYTDETQNGRLLITCHTEGDFLVFTVRNNGPQIQEEKARRSLKQPGKGYGLFNIQERIALYYGDGCGLNAGLDEKGYTCFTVKIKKSCTIDR